MNLTIGNGKISIRKSIPTQYVATVAGLALAVSAMASISSWHDSGRAVPSIVSQSSRLSISAPRSEQAPLLAVFIAGSQQQADDHRASVTQDLNPLAAVTYSYRVVTNGEEDAQAAYFIETAASELANAGTTMQVVDLRK